MNIATVSFGRMRTRRRKLKTGSSTAPVVFESGRSSITAIGSAGVWPRPRNRAAIGFVLHGADRVALDHNHVNSPDLFVITRTLAAMGKDRIFRGKEFRFDKKIAERRMGRVRLRRARTTSA